MKHLFAIALLFVPGLLAAKETCTKRHAHRIDVSRVEIPRVDAPRATNGRVTNSRPLRAWQRSVLFEMQIL